MLLKFYVMALVSENVSLTGWYRIDDFPSQETRLGSDFVNFHLGVLNSRGDPKPAFYALRFLDRLFSSPARRADLQVARSSGSQAVMNAFQTTDHRLIVMGWMRSSQSAEVQQKTGVLEDRRSETLSAELPCTDPALIGYYDAEGHRVSEPAKLIHGSLTNIRLTGSRLFIAELHCANHSAAR
jgi:hypothetical protein